MKGKASYGLEVSLSINILHLMTQMNINNSVDCFRLSILNFDTLTYWPSLIQSLTVEPTGPLEPTGTVEPTVTVEPTRAAEPTVTVEPTGTEEPAEPTGPVGQVMFPLVIFPLQVTPMFCAHVSMYSNVFRAW